LFGRPFTHAQGDLRQRHGSAHHVGGGIDHHGSGRQHIDHRGLGLGGNRRGGQRQRGQAKTSQHIHLVIDHHFLRQALGHIRGTGVIFEDDFNLAPGHGGAVHLHVQTHTGIHLAPGGSKRPGHGREQADFEWLVLCPGLRQ